MRIHYYLLFFCLIAVLFTPQKAYALGKMAHQLTCELAFQQLSKPAQDKVIGLLNAMDTKHVRAINKYNHRNKNEAITFAKSCTWADAIKRERRYKKFKSWHYLNVNRNSSKVTSSTCTRSCVTQAIQHHHKQLQTITNTSDKLEALLFLSHWVGDIHQPLHVSFASDLGGNKTQIHPLRSQCDNLHWFWDVCLLASQSNKKKKSHQYQELQGMLNKQLNTNTLNGQAQVWKKSSEIDWANESLQIVRNKAFGYCTMKGNKCVNNSKPFVITEQYQQTFAPVLNQRILQASVRLSALLESAL